MTVTTNTELYSVIGECIIHQQATVHHNVYSTKCPSLAFNHTNRVNNYH